MICVIQRVTQANVTVQDRVISQIAQGMLVLLAIQPNDTQQDITWMARKLTTLRIFPKEAKNFDLDVKESNSSILLVSNFTIAADATKGRRPSLSGALDPKAAEIIFNQLIQAIKGTGTNIQTGQFGADMKINLTNDGPVTFLLDSHEKPQ
jgi:D-aminoacyl-tRNA deacylase